MCILFKLLNIKASFTETTFRCLDMQKKESKPTSRDEDGRTIKRQKQKNCKCPFYKQTLIEDLSNLALSDIQDVEDLVGQGKSIKACPYYASRKASEDAQIVLVPYNTILHKATREANGIEFSICI